MDRSHRIVVVVLDSEQVSRLVVLVLGLLFHRANQSGECLGLEPARGVVLELHLALVGIHFVAQTTIGGVELEGGGVGGSRIAPVPREIPVSGNSSLSALRIVGVAARIGASTGGPAGQSGGVELGGDGGSIRLLHRLGTAEIVKVGRGYLRGLSVPWGVGGNSPHLIGSIALGVGDGPPRIRAHEETSKSVILLLQGVHQGSTRIAAFRGAQPAIAVHFDGGGFVRCGSGDGSNAVAGIQGFGGGGCGESGGGLDGFGSVHVRIRLGNQNRERGSRRPLIGCRSTIDGWIGEPIVGCPFCDSILTAQINNSIAVHVHRFNLNAVSWIGVEVDDSIWIHASREAARRIVEARRGGIVGIVVGCFVGINGFVPVASKILEGDNPLVCADGFGYRIDH